MSSSKNVGTCSEKTLPMAEDNRRCKQSNMRFVVTFSMKRTFCLSFYDRSICFVSPRLECSVPNIGLLFRSYASFSNAPCNTKTLSNYALDICINTKKLNISWKTAGKSFLSWSALCGSPPTDKEDGCWRREMWEKVRGIVGEHASFKQWLYICSRARPV